MNKQVTHRLFNNFPPTQPLQNSVKTSSNCLFEKAMKSNLNDEVIQSHLFENQFSNQIEVSPERKYFYSKSKAGGQTCYEIQQVIQASAEVRKNTDSPNYQKESARIEQNQILFQNDEESQMMKELQGRFEQSEYNQPEKRKNYIKFLEKELLKNIIEERGYNNVVKVELVLQTRVPIQQIQINRAGFSNLSLHPNKLKEQEITPTEFKEKYFVEKDEQKFSEQLVASLGIDEENQQDERENQSKVKDVKSPTLEDHISDLLVCHPDIQSQRQALQNKFDVPMQQSFQNQQKIFKESQFSPQDVQFLQKCESLHQLTTQQSQEMLLSQQFQDQEDVFGDQIEYLNDSQEAQPSEHSKFEEEINFNEDDEEEEAAKIEEKKVDFDQDYINELKRQGYREIKGNENETQE